MIPARCTSLMQFLDVAINKPLKDILHTLVEDAIDLYEQRMGEDLHDSGKASAMEDRWVLIQTQTCLAEAWHAFCSTRRDIIVTSFRKVGLSLPIDRSCDLKLSIKGILSESEGLVIGDWRLHNGISSTEVKDWGAPGGPGNEDNLIRENLECLLPENEDEDETEFVDRDW
ncbi:hypothetical protein HOY82DRAFT_613891 [Tuber indicum]|nr:hypothetical protein HOY82DRAFT_613891 [Tuber indicum]